MIEATSTSNKNSSTMNGGALITRGGSRRGILPARDNNNNARDNNNNNNSLDNSKTGGTNGGDTGGAAGVITPLLGSQQPNNARSSLHDYSTTNGVGGGGGGSVVTSTYNKNTVQMSAPTDLPGGYEFLVDVDGCARLVRVPEDGVDAGETFTALLVQPGDIRQPPFDSRYNTMSSRSYDVYDHQIPHGTWRDGIFCCCINGCCHPMCCLALFCKPLALGQVMTREDLDACASSNPRPTYYEQPNQRQQPGRYTPPKRRSRCSAFKCLAFIYFFYISLYWSLTVLIAPYNPIFDVGSFDDDTALAPPPAAGSNNETIPISVNVASNIVNSSVPAAAVATAPGVAAAGAGAGGADDQSSTTKQRHGDGGRSDNNNSVRKLVDVTAATITEMFTNHDNNNTPSSSTTSSDKPSFHPSELPVWVAVVQSVQSFMMILFGLYLIFLLIRTRTYIRHKYHIGTGCFFCCCCEFCEDCCCAVFFPFCALTQMARHTADYHMHTASCCSDTGLSARRPEV